MIRNIKASDIGELQSLIEGSLYLADKHAVPSDSYILNAITAALEAIPNFYFKVYESKGRIVGFLSAQVTQSFMLSTHQANVITSYAKTNDKHCLDDLFQDMCKWADSRGAYDIYALEAGEQNGLSHDALKQLGAKPVTTEYKYQLHKD